MQIHLQEDIYVQNDLMRRAKDAGFRAIVITIDMPVSSLRYHNKRHQHKDIHAYANTERYRGNNTITWVRGRSTWDELAGAIRNTSLPVIVKGVLTPDDAKLAREHGARGIIVSNHGGRQLDGTISSVSAPQRRLSITDCLVFIARTEELVLYIFFFFLDRSISRDSGGNTRWKGN
jgi:isopentenyl diphosphate isomerase/L-lactate dehydrogenase-like FMN-dependent dehydrogenase